MLDANNSNDSDCALLQFNSRGNEKVDAPMKETMVRVVKRNRREKGERQEVSEDWLFLLF